MMGRGKNMLFFAIFWALNAPLSLAASPLVEFAFRNAQATEEAERRTFLLQGKRDFSFSFVSACGEQGERCTCLFYQGGNDTNPQPAPPRQLRKEQNVLACVLPPGSLRPERVSHLGVRAPNGNSLVSATEVKTTLSLADLLGNLSRGRVRSIFRYECMRTFFEGEGLAYDPPQCPAGQKLGLLEAGYHFFFFRAPDEQTYPREKIPLSKPYCGYASSAEYLCKGTEAQLRFGLYAEPAGIFTQPIELRHGPNEFPEVVGYAAALDRTGSCPLGFLKARPRLAQPASILAGSIDGQNPPSNFINTRNTLSEYIFDPEAPANFEVSRRQNAVPCGANGSCKDAGFAAGRVVQSVVYFPLTPVVCVIPRQALLAY